MTSIVDIGILNYPQAQAAAVLGLTDLFLTANRLISGSRGQQFRVSEWRVQSAGGPVELIDCSGDAP